MVSFSSQLIDKASPHIYLFIGEILVVNIFAEVSKLQRFTLDISLSSPLVTIHEFTPIYPFGDNGKPAISFLLFNASSSHLQSFKYYLGPSQELDSIESWLSDNELRHVSDASHFCEIHKWRVCIHFLLGHFLVFALQSAFLFENILARVDYASN